MADRPRALQVAAYRYNCQPCKQRKTKCDRVKPCASCCLRGTQHRCYVDEHDAASPSAAAALAAALPPAAQQRARKKPRVSPTTNNAVSTSSSVPSSSLAPLHPPPIVHDHASAVTQHIALLRQTINSLEASISSTSPPAPATAPATTPSSAHQLISRSPSVNLPTSSDPIVITSNPRLTWNDVAHVFPPKRDVERILDYFLREMVYIMIPVQEKQIWRAWKRLIHSHASCDEPHHHQQCGISRAMVGSLLLCLASTSHLIPQRREDELDLTRRMAEQRDGWITAALALVRCGTVLPTTLSSSHRAREWLHYVDPLTETSLDRFGFDVLAVRMFVMLGMSEVAYHLNGECLRRAIRINLFDESSAKAAELFSVDDAYLTPHDVTQMRRRLAVQAVVIERWTCLYTGRSPMIDEDAATLPLPDDGFWFETEQITHRFSQFVSRLRLLPAQLSSLTSRKAADWSTQRARDQEAVRNILDLDRGLCSMYDPSHPRASLSNRSHTQIVAELPELLQRNSHAINDPQLNQLHREFAEAVVMTSSWLSLRCLVTSNLMFLPWVSDARERYYALNLARRLIELVPSIWMITSSPYVPFSSSFISRHLFLACTILSIPILGQEPSPSPTPTTTTPTPLQTHFEPSRLQKQHFFSRIPPFSKMLPETQRLPPSSAVDLDWFSGKLVEIASLFSKMAQRGDQTAGVNTKLIHALLNSRTELRDRVLDKIGQLHIGRCFDASEDAKTLSLGMGMRMRSIESQTDLTDLVAASSMGKSPTSTSPVSSSSSSVVKPPPLSRVVSARRQSSVASPSLHDLANAVDFTHAKPSVVTTGVVPQIQTQQHTQHTQHTQQVWNQHGEVQNATANDMLANVPLLLDPHDWMAILDGVDIFNS